MLEKRHQLADRDSFQALRGNSYMEASASRGAGASQTAFPRRTWDDRKPTMLYRTLAILPAMMKTWQVDL